MNGGDNKSGGDADDLLSRLLDLEDEPQDTTPPSEESEGFFQKTLIPDSDKTELLVKNDRTELLSKSQVSKLSSPVDDFLNLDSEADATSDDLNELASAADFLDHAKVENDDKKSSSLDSIFDGPEDATIMDSNQNSENFGDAVKGDTLVLDEPLEAAPAASTPQVSEDADPIDAALAEYAASSNDTGGLNVDGSGTEVKSDLSQLIEESSQTEEQSVHQAGKSFGGKKELSAEDFADVFQSGPIQVPQESYAKPRALRGNSKRIVAWFGAVAGVLAILGGGIWRFQSEEGIFGYRMESWNLETVYRAPDEATREEFAKTFGEVREAFDFDDPSKIKALLVSLPGILKRDERNFEAASLLLESLGRLIAWEGVKVEYTSKYDETYQQTKSMANRIKTPLNWDATYRADAWKFMATGELSNSMSQLESRVTKPSDADNLALLGELAYRTDNIEKATSFLNKLGKSKNRRGIFYLALLKNDLSTIQSLAKDKYLPAEIEVELREISSDNSREALSKMNKVYERSKDYPWLAIKIQSRRGDLYSSLGDEAKAREEWQGILDRNPNDADAWFKIAMSNERDSLWDPAVEAYRSSLKSGGMRKAVALRLIALLRVRMKVVEALDTIEQAIQAYPKSPELYFERGETQLTIYQEDAARQSFAKSLELDPNFEPATLSLAGLNLRQQEWKQAEEIYKKIPASSPNYALALKGLGELSLRQHRLNQAQKFFALSLKEDLRHESTYAHLTSLLLRSEEDQKALALVESGLALMPKSVNLHITRARILSFMGKDQEALDQIEPYFESHNHLEELSIARAEILIAAGKSKEAREILKSLELREVRDTRVNYLMGRAYFIDEDDKTNILGAKESAWRLAQQALKAEPENESYLVFAAQVALAMDERALAQEIIERTLKVYPDNFKVLVFRGDLKFRTGFNDEAIANFRRALSRTRFKGDIYRKLAVVYTAKGDTLRAIQNFSLVTEWFPGDARSHLELGKLYNDQGLFDRAKRSLRKAVQIDPQLADAYYFLAFIQKDSGEKAQAVRNFEKYLELDPNGVEAATVKDEVYFLKNGSIEN